MDNIKSNETKRNLTYPGGVVQAEQGAMEVRPQVVGVHGQVAANTAHRTHKRLQRTETRPRPV